MTMPGYLLGTVERDPGRRRGNLCYKVMTLAALGRAREVDKRPIRGTDTRSEAQASLFIYEMYI